MGEAHERAKLGLAPRIMKPGEQIQVNIDLKDSKPEACRSCGCEYFTSVIQVFVISPLVSPTGQEMIAQRPILICSKCQEPLNLKPAKV